MTERSEGVTKRLLERLLDEQRRRAARERKMPYAEKLKVVDRLMAEAVFRETEAGQLGGESREREAEER